MKSNVCAVTSADKISEFGESIRQQYFNLGRAHAVQDRRMVWLALYLQDYTRNKTTSFTESELFSSRELIDSNVGWVLLSTPDLHYVQFSKDVYEQTLSIASTDNKGEESLYAMDYGYKLTGLKDEPCEQVLEETRPCKRKAEVLSARDARAAKMSKVRHHFKHEYRKQLVKNALDS